MLCLTGPQASKKGEYLYFVIAVVVLPDPWLYLFGSSTNHLEHRVKL